MNLRTSSISPDWWDYTCLPLDIVEEVARLTPKGVDRIQLYSSGAEAVESAFRLAKNATGKFEVARELFDKITTDDEFVEFLTLPGYERLD